MLIAIFVVLFLSVGAIGIFHFTKRLPEGVSFRGERRGLAVDQAQFFADVTAVREGNGQRWVRQEIFEEVIRRIRSAGALVVADFFLINEFAGASVDPGEGTPSLSSRFVGALEEAKRENPSMPVILITDPINTVYGGVDQPLLERLRRVGVEVVLTDLHELRDSNRLYSPLWRTFVEWWGGGSPRGDLVSNPLGEGKVGVSAILELLNFKANHRKVLVTGDKTGKLEGLVTSANPHSASVWHGNVALGFEGVLAADLLRSEEAVYRFSTGRNFPPSIRRFYEQRPVPEDREAVLGGVVLTEREIKTELLERISQLNSGDEADLTLFYFSDFDLRKALAEAVQKGVRVRLLLDPNKDAFGRDKNGVPNRQVAEWLSVRGVKVRWYRTGGEQFHTKMAFFRQASGEATLMLGSANWTRRNLDNLNLETCVSISGPLQTPVLQEAGNYFSLVWSNEFQRGEDGIPGDLRTSVPYEEYRDPSFWRRLQYFHMEKSGVSTF